MFRKWKEVWEIFTDTFLGIPIKKHWIRFIYSEKTDQAKEYFEDSQGGSWSYYLTKDELQILKSKMKKVDDHYELVDNINE